MKALSTPSLWLVLLAGPASLSAQTEIAGAGDDERLRGTAGRAIGWQGPEIEVELQLEAQRARRQEALDGEALEGTALQGDIRLGARQSLGRRVDLEGEVRLRSRRLFESRDDDDDDDRDDDADDTELELRRLFVQIESPDRTSRLRFGRQKIDDDLAWYVDEDLDGLRYTHERGFVRVDLSLTRESWVEAGEERDDIVYNALAAVRLDAGKRSKWIPWVLHRSEEAFADERAAETTWLGLQGIVRIDDTFGYWLNAATRFGTEERGDEDRALRGGALDLGVTARLALPFEPAFTLGFAHATGDDDRGDGDDLNFRQTGLHANEYAPNGRNRFRYLGEVIDPELSNLEVITVGVGAELAERWDADIAYHRYRQVRNDDALRGSDLSFDPTGDEDEIGSALDLVLGYERSDALDVLGVIGLFEPGEAFADGAELAWVVRLALEWNLAFPR